MPAVLRIITSFTPARASIVAAASAPFIPQEAATLAYLANVLLTFALKTIESTSAGRERMR